jgi:hypothetical protein
MAEVNINTLNMAQLDMLRKQFEEVRRRLPAPSVRRRRPPPAPDP